MIPEKDHDTEPVRPLLNIAHFKKQIAQIRENKLKEARKPGSRPEGPAAEKNKN